MSPGCHSLQVGVDRGSRKQVRGAEETKSQFVAQTLEEELRRKGVWTQLKGSQVPPRKDGKVPPHPRRVGFLVSLTRSVSDV